jgi:hypothetical protein
LKKLWRTLRNKLFSAAYILTLLESINTKVIYFGKNSSVNHKTQLKKKVTLQDFVIDPEHKFNILWRMLIFCLLVYNALGTPFRFSFHTTPTSNALFAWETTTDIILALDILITFFTPYQRIDGSFEKSNVKIARRYI